MFVFAITITTHHFFYELCQRYPYQCWNRKWGQSIDCKAYRMRSWHIGCGINLKSTKSCCHQFQIHILSGSGRLISEAPFFASDSEELTLDTAETGRIRVDWKRHTNTGKTLVSTHMYKLQAMWISIKNSVTIQNNTSYAKLSNVQYQQFNVTNFKMI